MNTALSALWRKVCEDDPDAWARLVKEYAGLVYAVARRARLDHSDAEDCAQLTWLALYRSRFSLRDAQALPAWLIRTTRRNALRLAKRREGGGESRVLPTPSEPPSQLREAELAEFRADLPHALLALDPRCRKLLEGLYLESASYEELARALGLQSYSIGPLRSRCLLRLRQILEKMGWSMN